MAPKEVSLTGAPKPFLTRLTREAVPRHEIDFISKIGRLSREEVIELLNKHRGDREAVFLELASRRIR